MSRFIPFILLALLLGVAFAIPRPASAQTATPPPTPVYQATPLADTYVRNRLAEQTINYGFTSSLLYRSFSNNNATAFIYWGLPDETAKNVTSAIMWFNISNNPQPVALWETWPIDETLLFASAPPPVNFLGVVTPTLGWNSYDISGSIRDNKTIMFVSEGENISAVTFTTVGSRQSANSPYILYELAPTPTPSATPTPSVTPTPAPASYTVDLPDGGIANVTMSMGLGDFAVAVLLMLVLVPLVLLVFQNWGGMINGRG
jgi:hypothetical protein